MKYIFFIAFLFPFVIISNTFRFTSSVSFETHILIYIIQNTHSKSPRVLQLERYLSKLIINGY